MNADTLTARIETRQAELEGLWGEVDRVQEQIRKLVSAQEQDRHALARLIRPQGYPTVEAVLAAPWSQIERDGCYQQAVSVLEPLHERGLYTSMGRWPETDQRMISVMMDQNRPLDEQMGALDILPLLRPFEDGTRRFEVFDSSLSSNGSYYLHVAEDGKTELLHRRWTEQTFPGLREALAHVYRFLPYQHANGEE